MFGLTNKTEEDSQNLQGAQTAWFILRLALYVFSTFYVTNTDTMINCLDVHVDIWNIFFYEFSSQIKLFFKL